MIELQVKTSQPYSVRITHGWEKLALPQDGRVCVVTDTNVAPLYLRQVLDTLGDRAISYVLQAGEQSKCLQTYESLLSFLAENGFQRSDTVVALGGGVVGDLVGFVAATYMRGIRYFQIPTTLLAMIDSSVGGKTAINLPQGKNLVGAFWQPIGVYINVDTLDTLPQREKDNGLGELVKYAFLNDKITLGKPTSQLIANCLQTKIDVVQQDERESGKRMLLNLGHTVGHAVEALSNYTIPHGLCVAKGLAATISLSQNFFGVGDFEQMKALLDSTGLDTSIPFEKSQIIQQISKDKKTCGNTVNFVLIKQIGCCQVVPIEISQLEKLL